MTTEDPKTEIEVPKSRVPEPSSDARHRKLRKIGGLLAGFAAVGTVLAGLTGYWTTYRTVTKEILAPAKQEPIAPRLSIAVLPFSNLTGDPAQDYLGDVITEELTTSLSRIPHSFVIARSTAFTYKGKSVDVRQIGKDLGVRYILEGSQEQGGNKVRVNAQLIDADTGAHLWADQFDADRTDLLDMQDEIVTRLSRALQIRLVEVDAARVARTHPGDPDADQLAMRCEAVLVDTQLGSSAEADEGYSLCERALQRDERNVRALVNLSFKFINRILSEQSLDREADVRQADELARGRSRLTQMTTGFTSPRPRFCWARSTSTRRSSRRNAPSPSIPVSSTHTAPWVLEAAFSASRKRLSSMPTKRCVSVRVIQYCTSFIWKKDLLYPSCIRTIRLSTGCVERSPAAPQWPLPQALLASALSLTGHEVEGRDMLKRYLSLRGTRARTIAQWKEQMPSSNPLFLAYAERLVEGLRKAGLPE